MESEVSNRFKMVQRIFLQSDFVLGGLDGIRSMADVASSDEAVITTDGSYPRSQLHVVR